MGGRHAATTQGFQDLECGRSEHCAFFYVHHDGRSRFPCLTCSCAGAEEGLATCAAPTALGPQTTPSGHMSVSPPSTVDEILATYEKRQVTSTQLGKSMVSLM